MDKEEVLEVEEQMQKLEKDFKITQEEKNIKAIHKSTVSATSVTELGCGKENLVKDAVMESNKSCATSPIEKAKQTSATILNPQSNDVKNPPLTSGVPPTTKKAEDSKQL
jgi:hypothetical protein